MKKPSDRTTSKAVPKKEHLRWEYARRSKKLRAYYDYWITGTTESKFSTEFEIEALKNFPQVLEYFGSKSSEEWWEKSGKFRFEDIDRQFPPTKVENLLEQLPHIMAFAWKGIAKREGRNPGLDELWEAVERLLYSEYIVSCVLKIEMKHGTPKEIEIIQRGVKKQLQNIIKKTRFVQKRLEIYLEVFDLRTKAKLSNDEVILKIGKETEKQAIREVLEKDQVGDSDPENIRRDYRRYLAKAKKIIGNIEKGEFPGKY